MTEIQPSDQPEMPAMEVGDVVPVPADETPAPQQVDALAPQQVDAPTPQQVDAPTPQQVDVPTPQQVGGAPAPKQFGTPAPQQHGTSQMGGLPVEDWDYQQPKRGEIRTGVILAITDQEIIIDVGAKRDGQVPLADLQRMSPEALAKLSVGDKVPVYVLRPEDQDGNLMISLYQARQEKDWLRAQELAKSGEVWEEEVVGFNKGGLVIPLGGIRGFVPASQIADFRPTMTSEERLERLSSMVGERLKVKVIELNQHKHRLILSSTQAQREWREQQRDRLLDELREGEVRHGVVSSLSPFGAFVDIGGADGLVHLSELSWRRLRHPRELLHVGDEIDVIVLHLDREHKRIALSRKRLEPEPWALVEDNYELGQLVEGVITNVADFGAFAEIESGIEGLIHISELADNPVSNPREVVRRGEQVLLRIIRIDSRRKRLGLSLKRVLESEWSEWAARTGARKEKTAPPRPMAEPVVEEFEPEMPVEEAAPEMLIEVVEPEMPVEEAAPEMLVEVVEPEMPVEEAAPEILVEEAAPEMLVEVVEPEMPVEEAAPEMPLEGTELETPDGSLASDEVVEVSADADTDLSVVEG